MNKKAFSLIETLVVIGVFSVISIIVSQSLLTSLKNSRKSEGQVYVRENLNYVLSVMERQIRNAEKITVASCTSTYLPFITETGTASSFSCNNLSGTGRVMQGTSRLNSSQIDIETCQFTCTEKTASVPQKVDISLSASSPTASGADDTLITSTTTIFLRVY